DRHPRRHHQPDLPRPTGVAGPAAAGRARHARSRVLRRVAGGRHLTAPELRHVGREPNSLSV
ncbi:MAG: hypothetical protein AVDCRST_MAG10-1041, partial [uncultured Acidimicrobiales bacterium]